MGWVSIFDPDRLGALLGMPDDAEPVAVLCLGPVPDFPDRPALEIDRWTFGRPLAEFVSENGWSTPDPGRCAPAPTRSPGRCAPARRRLAGVSARDHRPQRRPWRGFRGMATRGRRCHARRRHQRQRRMRFPRRRPRRVWRATCRAAAQRGVRIGAQVSYRDLAGFGRRYIDMDAEDLTADVMYQIGALQALASAAGSTVGYVKPHGALYNTIVTDRGQAAAVAAAVHAVDPGLPVLGLAGSEFFAAATGLGLRTVPEAFADRAYRPDGQLVSRREPGAVLGDAGQIADRVASMVGRRPVDAVDGSTIPITVESVCVHGDSPGAVRIANGRPRSAHRRRRRAEGIRLMRLKLGRPEPRRLRRLLRPTRRDAAVAADRHVGGCHHAADRRRRVGADDGRVLLPPRPARPSARAGSARRCRASTAA